MSAVAKCPSTGTVLVAVPGDELRRQLIGFLATLGYACVAMSRLEAALRMLQGSSAGLEILVGDVPLPEAESVAAAVAAARLTMRMLFLSSEPESVTRNVVPNPGVMFVEKPFAWCDLKAVLSAMSGASPACGC